MFFTQNKRLCAAVCVPLSLVMADKAADLRNGVQIARNSIDSGCLSVCAPIDMFVYLSVCFSICVYLFVYRSIQLSVCVSVYTSALRVPFCAAA